jgi:hypothetical protein
MSRHGLEHYQGTVWFGQLAKRSESNPTSALKSAAFPSIPKMIAIQQNDITHQRY